MQVGGETHTHDIVIASYRKPEFQVEVTPDKPRYIKGETVSATVKGTYYFGGALAGAKASYTITKQPDWASYEEPESDTGDGEYEGESGGEYVASGDVVLDENGEAKNRTAQRREEKRRERKVASGRCRLCPNRKVCDLR